MVAIQFKPGTVFRHGRWLDPGSASREKAICRVTAIRRGQVYYGFGADARKASFHTSPERLLADGAEIIA